ncbi:hypothetical protein COL60_11085 [Bacillus pseudomycoides]|nr:hypothetical protein CN686_20540 [Bacillus pseudomycoides]PEM64894.1 hypothetical protein CN619_27075 [Bacillus pseudomycoides]PFZ10223.1 hypothetical protein COL60_11085 [Bacillus pseudomycoides]PGA64675.1 hypothetical protein COL84_02575 [Bacillus pseudomycoides]PHA48071.1 hypothetical protein COE73_17770 [Bacillus pseudomycoides]
MQLKKMQALMKKSTYYEHVRELVVGANQYGINMEWSSELPNRTERSRLWRHDLIDTRDTYYILIR